VGESFPDADGVSSTFRKTAQRYAFLYQTIVGGGGGAQPMKMVPQHLKVAQKSAVKPLDARPNTVLDVVKKFGDVIGDVIAAAAK